MSPRALDLAGVLLDVDTGERTYVPFNTPLWEATLEWARFHGIDPCEVPAGSVIERDATRCEIRYEVLVPRVVRDGRPVSVLRVERGEAPPLPFPTGGPS